MFQPSRLSRAVALFTLGVAMSANAVADDTTQLDALTVTATKGATKTETPVVETPQSVSVIESEDWQEKGAESVQRAANYTPGVATNQVGSSNRYDYLILRGFSGGSINNTFLDGLKVMNDGGSFSSFAIDPWFLERIEIVKGPSSVLYGRSSPGGIVALTSKRPEYESGGEVRARLGNNAQREFAFDVTGPVDDDQRVAYRLTGILSAADAQQDFVEEERRAIAPSLMWDITNDTSLTLLAYLQRDPEGGYHNGLPYEGTVVPRNGREIDNTFFDGEPDYEQFSRDMAMVGYDLEHQLNSQWSVTQKFRHLSSDVAIQQVYASGWASGSSTELLRGYSGGEENLEAVTVDNQIKGHLATGAVDHTLLAGLDYQQRRNDVISRYGSASAIDAFNPQYGAAPVISTVVRNLREVRQTGAYLQDQLAIGGWRLNLGGRYDWVDIENTNRDTNTGSELDETQFSGRAGLLYYFDNGIAPYASYSTSFSPNALTDANGDLVEPSEGRQVETGLKYQPVGTSDLYTLSLFRIHQENLATKQPQENFYRAVGEIRSQGAELETRTQMTENFSVQLGYAYTDVTFETSEPYREGNDASQVPRHQLTAWADYRFTDGALSGANAGLGVRHMADIWADDANTRQVPDYTLVDLALGYDFGHVGLPGVSARLNINNLLDKEYVSSCYNSTDFCYFGAERNVTATASYRF